jgi:hypothetical protein
MIFVLCIAGFVFSGFCFGRVYEARRYSRILKPRDDRPFTSDELKQMGIVAPERYDCETFVR